ncbi:P-II family nitrogen regulator [Frisingicoccus sp.]|uniref:P-II family nitrogen regulator n=1 Tax=Frisingicoccus sp. TaxID=1918627 RepID=UPI003AB5DE2E
MKELTIIIKPEKLEAIKQIVDKNNCSGMTISTVMGCGTQKGHAENDEIAHTVKVNRVRVNLLPKIRVDIVIPDVKLNDFIIDVCNEVSSGKVGDGKIFVRDIEDAVRIRTGERGDKVL